MIHTIFVNNTLNILISLYLRLLWELELTSTYIYCVKFEIHRKLNSKRGRTFWSIRICSIISRSVERSWAFFNVQVWIGCWFLDDNKHFRRSSFEKKISYRYFRYWYDISDLICDYIFLFCFRPKAAVWPQERISFI